MSDLASIYIQVIVPAADFDNVAADICADGDESACLAMLETEVDRIVRSDGVVMVMPVRDAVMLTLEGAQVCLRAFEALDAANDDENVVVYPENGETADVIRRALEVIASGG